MKKLKFIFIAAFLVMTSVAIQAQPRQHPKVSKADFPQFQVQMMIKQLLIEEPKREAFSKIYLEYTADLAKIRTPRKGEPRRDGAVLSDAEIEQQILKSFEAAEKSTALKKQYYAKFKDVLTPQQILKMYKIEKTTRERIMEKSHGRAPQGQGRPQPQKRLE